MENLLGMKELYEVALKATDPREINNRIIEEGETIALFDNIQIANLDEVKGLVTANGGFDNRAHVFWETTKEINLYFTQGIFSKTHLALMSNAKLYTIDTLADNYKVQKIEVLESDENGIITFEKTPQKEKLFIYDSDGNKIIDYEFVDGNHINIKESYKEVNVYYYFLYNNGVTQMRVGQKLIEGFVSLEGKTRLRDDKTGKIVTGIIKIPKLKLMSDLSIRLGRNASPLVANFRAIGCPIGAKGNKTVLDMYFLEDDIDSDI